MRLFSYEAARVKGGEFSLIDDFTILCRTLSQSSNPRTGLPDELAGGNARPLMEVACDLPERVR